METSEDLLSLVDQLWLDEQGETIVLYHLDETSRILQEEERFSYCWWLVEAGEVVAYMRTFIDSSVLSRQLLQHLEVRQDQRGKKLSNRIVEVVETVTGLQIYSSGEWTPEGYLKLRHRFPSRGASEQYPSLPATQYVLAWATLETVY